LEVDALFSVGLLAEAPLVAFFCFISSSLFLSSKSDADIGPFLLGWSIFRFFVATPTSVLADVMEELAGRAILVLPVAGRADAICCGFDIPLSMNINKHI
jgi:hypothetical protein